MDTPRGRPSRPHRRPSATSSVEVVKSTAVVRDGEIVEYHVEVKIGFEYEG